MKVDVLNWKPPAKERREFSCLMMDGQKFSVTVEKLGTAGALAAFDQAEELLKSVTELPVEVGGQTVRASLKVCQIVASVGSAQVTREADVAYTDRELLTLMLDERVMELAFNASEWVASEIGEETIELDEQKKTSAKSGSG